MGLRDTVEIFFELLCRMLLIIKHLNTLEDAFCCCTHSIVGASGFF